MQMTFLGLSVGWLLKKSETDRITDFFIDMVNGDEIENIDIEDPHQGAPLSENIFFVRCKTHDTKEMSLLWQTYTQTQMWK